MAIDGSAGREVSRTEIRQTLGRKSCQCPKNHHEGKTSDPTAHSACINADNGNKTPPSEGEIADLLKKNPKETAALRMGGLKDHDIYEILEKKYK